MSAGSQNFSQNGVRAMTQPNSPYTQSGANSPQQMPQYPQQAPYAQTPYAQTPGTNQANQPPQMPPHASPYTTPMNGPAQPQQLRDVALSQPVYGISAPQAFLRFFKKYATFSGRASRSEYWWMQMWFTVFSFVMFFLLSLTSNGTSAAISFISGIVGLGTFVPQLALTIRRYHDANKSGVLYLASILPSVLGGILLAIGLVGLTVTLAGAASSSYGYDAGYGNVGTAFITPALNGFENGIPDGYGYDSDLYGYGFDGGEFYGNLDTSALGVWGVLIGVGLLIVLAGAIVNLVITLLGSKPEGVRFDKPQLPPQYTVYPPNTMMPAGTAFYGAGYSGAGYAGNEGNTSPNQNAGYGPEAPYSSYDPYAAGAGAGAGQQMPAQQQQYPHYSQYDQGVRYGHGNEYSQYGQSAPTAGTDNHGNSQDGDNTASDESGNRAE